MKEMERNGTILAYNVTPCVNAGHSLRNRYGKCIICNPKLLAFNNRADKAGFVYAAYSASARLVKVGFTENLSERHKALVSWKYAGCDDWKLFHSEEREDAGRLEIAAHKALAKYAALDLLYARDGKLQLAKEVYRCSKEDAVQALAPRRQY